MVDATNGARFRLAAAPNRLVIESGEAGCLILRGEIDAASAWSLALALEDPDIVRLDCAAVSFFGAAGLRVLLRGGALRRLTLRSPSLAVRRVLQFTGQTDAFAFEAPTHDRNDAA